MASAKSSSKSNLRIECSVQPLDLSFHPERETIVAAALVDGTLEVHDFEALLSCQDAKPKADQDDDDDEDDTILSSTAVHTQNIPVPNRNGDSTTNVATKNASCRTVLFSNNQGHRLFTGGSAGDVVCIDASRVCSFSSKTANSILWRIEEASVGTSLHNPLHVLHQLPATCCKGNLIVSGDDHGGVRLWDERLLDTKTTKGSNQMQRNNQRQSSDSALKLPKGCVLSWKEHNDYISDLTHSEDGNTLVATSSDGCLSVFDIRKSSTSNILQNSQYVKKSDPQDDELLSVAILKHGRKIVAGTHEGVVAVWSWGTWGDISDRFPTVCPKGTSMDAILKMDEDTFLTGTSDGRIRVVTIHPNKVLGSLGDHDHGFPIEALGFSANRKYVGSVSHDPYIRLWDTKNLILHDDDEEDEEEDKQDDKPRKRPAPAAAAAAAKVNKGAKKLKTKNEEFFSDL
ncbi:WD repeat-containing protein 55 [Seminavis robusta]|uniref:WD repeat-containing protein 55 n=1 Tax=Seminavis robusta TaxID=568900 RepID=A0A9N8F5F6_9STRA|nr:WD repeat-containing protein 55 [Seminavis robusta]|eukprot:Sro3376_g347390.1 WD repeat-containing protein 55 (457) ;mRNA; f:2064-3563